MSDPKTPKDMNPKASPPAIAAAKKDAVDDSLTKTADKIVEELDSIAKNNRGFLADKVNVGLKAKFEALQKTAKGLVKDDKPVSGKVEVFPNEMKTAINLLEIAIKRKTPDRNKDDAQAAIADPMKQKLEGMLKKFLGNPDFDHKKKPDSKNKNMRGALDAADALGDLRTLLVQTDVGGSAVPGLPRGSNKPQLS